MNDHQRFEALLNGAEPISVLAPMQDVTDLPFWRVMSAYGGPDIYFTEYFRVYPNSTLDKNILKCVTENPTGRPAIAQLIGNDIPALTSAARELQEHPIVAVDLNLGCPAPVVYRKRAGGGLLREVDTLDAILGALRDVIRIKFTVKTRLGFESPDGFDTLLKVFGRHHIDMLTVHGRTVKDMYRSAVRYDLIATAVQALDCPVLANGNIYNAARALEVARQTGAQGLMIGRAAIRNPWIFRQIQSLGRGETPVLPKGREVLDYLTCLYEWTRPPNMNGAAQVKKMKKYLNYIGLGIDAQGGFLHEIRRVTTEKAFFQTCEAYLDHSEPMALEPMEIPMGPRDLLAGAHR